MTHQKPDLGTHMLGLDVGAHEKLLVLTPVFPQLAVQDSDTEMNVSFVFCDGDTEYLGSAFVEMNGKSPEEIATQVQGCNTFTGKLSVADTTTGNSGEEYIPFRGMFSCV